MKRKAKEARCNQNGAAARAKKLVTQCLCKQRRLSFPIAWVADHRTKKSMVQCFTKQQKHRTKTNPNTLQASKQPIEPIHTLMLSPFLTSRAFLVLSTEATGGHPFCSQRPDGRWTSGDTQNGRRNPPESGRLGYHFLLSFLISYGYR